MDSDLIRLKPHIFKKFYLVLTDKVYLYIRTLSPRIKKGSRGMWNFTRKIEDKRIITPCEEIFGKGGKYFYDRNDNSNRSPGGDVSVDSRAFFCALIYLLDDPFNYLTKTDSKYFFFSYTNLVFEKDKYDKIYDAFKKEYKLKEGIKKTNLKKEFIEEEKLLNIENHEALSKKILNDLFESFIQKFNLKGEAEIVLKNVPSEEEKILNFLLNQRKSFANIWNSLSPSMKNNVPFLISKNSASYYDLAPIVNIDDFIIEEIDNNRFSCDIISKREFELPTSFELLEFENAVSKNDRKNMGRIIDELNGKYFTCKDYNPLDLKKAYLLNKVAPFLIREDFKFCNQIFNQLFPLKRKFIEIETMICNYHIMDDNYYLDSVRIMPLYEIYFKTPHNKYGSEWYLERFHLFKDDLYEPFLQTLWADIYMDFPTFTITEDGFLLREYNIPPIQPRFFLTFGG